MMPTWNSQWYCRQKIIVWWRKTHKNRNKEKHVHEMTLCRNYSMDPKRKATMQWKINCRICLYAVRDKKLACTGNHKPLSSRWSPGTKHLIGRIQKHMLFHLQMMHWWFFPTAENFTFPTIPFKLHQDTACIPVKHDQIPERSQLLGQLSLTAQPLHQPGNRCKIQPHIVVRKK